MSKRNWTEEQELAITETGKNIIVSAGAGSGKTAVLTERVIRKLNGGMNINELLLLTFTNKAASEMKERIKEEIKEDEKLKSQLDLIDQSYITTFDSFSLSVVKKYNYLLNVSKDINIIDASLLKLKKEEIIDKIFDDYYKEENNLFIKIISDFCLKDDNEIKKYILNINNKLDLKINKREYLNNYIENNFNEEKIDNDIKLYEELLLKKIDDIKYLLDELYYLVDGEYFNKLYDSLKGLLDSNNYDEILYNININMPTLPRGSLDEIKALKNGIKPILDSIKDLLKYKNKDEIKENILSTKDYIKIIIDIILKLDEEITKFKYENNAFEFNDIEIMAINLLKNNSDIKDELKYIFKEIMVDEYQDTNDIQEEFISLIENNNVYMVGDIKQSIYRFRNANPYIFKNKYDKYSRKENGIKIDLTKNFRSRKEVLDDINIIFEKIMDTSIGGANYKKEHKMVAGNTSYTNINQNNNIDIYTYDYDSKGIYSKEEIEAFIIANDIKNKINNNYKVYDKENGERIVNYSDFVVIMDKSKNFELYKKIFEYVGVPLQIEKDENLVEDILINIIKNLMELILSIKNNVFDTKFKYNFISISRSMLYETSDEEIFKYFKEDNFKESDLYKKCYKLSMYIDNTSIKDFINMIIDEFNFYDNLIKLGNIENEILKIDYLLDISDSFSKIGYTINDFISYLDNIIEKDYEIKIKENKNNKESVRVITVHSSKGLEYNICYYSMLSSEFNLSDLYDRFMYDNKYGIITDINDENTIYKELLKYDYKKEEISERIRVFYVALTRAKEKMILILDNDKDKVSLLNKEGIVSNFTKIKYNSFKDMIYSIKDILDDKIDNIDINKVNITKNYNKIKENNYLNYINKIDEKLEVKEINIENKLKEEISFSKKENKLLTKEIKANMLLGTKVHYILESLDLKNPIIDIDDEFIKDKINKFINSGLLKNIDNAKVYKEYEFMYEEDNNLYHGIIDLLLIYDDYVDIIDYKLKNIDDDNYKKQLLGYKKYIENKLNKKVNTYLYSIFDESILEIK